MMLIYLFVFFMSSFLIYLAENRISSKKVCKLLIFVGLLMPCILAGLRDISIGTDVEIYVAPMFNLANTSNTFTNYYNSRVTSRFVYQYEFGFIFLIYIVTRLFSSLHFVLFSIQFLITFSSYLGLRNIEYMNGKKWLGMLVCYLMFYNTGLNAMRQYISISIFFYAFSFMLRKKKNSYLFFLFYIISILFHKSTIMGIVIYLMYCIMNAKNKKFISFKNHRIEKNKLVFISFICIIMLLIVNSSKISFLLNDFGMERYTVYINGNVSILTSQIIKLIPILIIYLLVRKDFMKNYKDGIFLLLLFFINIMLTQFSSINIFAIRIAYLFNYFCCITYSLLVYNKNELKVHKKIFMLLMLYLTVYWYYTFVLRGYSETYPYRFFF